MRLTAIILGIVLWASPARADAIYTYLGDPFTFTQGDYASGVSRVSGGFTLSETFQTPTLGTNLVLVDVMRGISDYSFTDGLQTLTPANSTATIRVGFNPDGTLALPGSDATQMSAWWILDVTGVTGRIWGIYANHGEFALHAMYGESAATIDDGWPAVYPGGPGAWTVTTPEPSAALLTLIAGLAMAALRVRAHQS